MSDLSGWKMSKMFGVDDWMEVGVGSECKWKWKWMIFEVARTAKQDHAEPNYAQSGRHITIVA